MFLSAQTKFSLDSNQSGIEGWKLDVLGELVECDFNAVART